MDSIIDKSLICVGCTILSLSGIVFIGTISRYVYTVIDKNLLKRIAIGVGIGLCIVGIIDRLIL